MRCAVTRVLPDRRRRQIPACAAASAPHGRVPGTKQQSGPFRRAHRTPRVTRWQIRLRRSREAAAPSWGPLAKRRAACEVHGHRSRRPSIGPRRACRRKRGRLRALSVSRFAYVNSRICTPRILPVSRARPVVPCSRSVGRRPDRPRAGAVLYQPWSRRASRAGGHERAIAGWSQLCVPTRFVVVRGLRSLGRLRIVWLANGAMILSRSE